MLAGQIRTLKRELAEMTAQREELARKVRAERADRELAKARNQRDRESRETISALLRTALEPLSLSEQLRIALNLILAVPWLSIESRGAIFLAEENGDLVLSVQHSLSDHLLSHCARVSPGYCLCGRAARTREIVYAAHIDGNHDVQYDGMKPHGHYCVPILFRDRLMGVLNLYLSDGHPKEPTEEAFLVTAADTLAGLIERKRMEEALRRAKETAESANTAKTIFLANVSHELRTPLNAIVGFSHILLKHKSQISPRFLRYLENIRVSGINLTEIINNVLDLAKIEAGRVELTDEEIDIRILIQSLYQISKDRAAEKGVRVQYEIAPDVPRTIRSDRTRINQILMNLADNAVKFTAKGGLVRIAVRRDAGGMLLEVADQGEGIPGDRLDAIFEPFEQADGSTTRLHGGTGLGLAIVRQLANMLGGSVTVQSTLGEGSLFTVRLPLRESREDARLEGELDWHQYRFPQGIRLLLAEDNAMNQEMVLATLEEVGLAADIANNGDEAAEMAARLQPPLILMDLHMPVVDGFDATRRIRANPETAGIPIIGLSADAFVERENEACGAGMTHFLTKPVDLNDLMPLLTRHLGCTRDGGSKPCPEEMRQPAPPALEERLRAGLAEIAALPLFESSRIVALCDALHEACSGYETPYEETITRIREAVFSRNSKVIPEIIRAAVAP